MRSWRCAASGRRELQRLLATERIDVVHLHGFDFHEYLPPPGPVPMLATLHLPLAWYPARVFGVRRPDVHLCCVSASQRRAAPAYAPPRPTGR